MTVYVVTSTCDSFQFRIWHRHDGLAAADAAYRHEVGHEAVTVTEMAEDEARALEEVEKVNLDSSPEV